MPPTNASMSSNMLSSILFASNRFISNGFKLLERRKRGKCGHHHSQTSCHQVFYPLSTACLLHKILFTTLWAQLLFSFCPLFRFLFPSFRSLPLSFAANCSYVPFLLTFHGVGDEQKGRDSLSIRSHDRSWIIAAFDLSCWYCSCQPVWLRREMIPFSKYSCCSTAEKALFSFDFTPHFRKLELSDFFRISDSAYSNANQP